MKKKIDADKLFESIVKRAEGFYYSEEVLEYASKTLKTNNEDGDEMVDELTKNNISKKSVSKKPENKNNDVDFDCKKQEREKNSEICVNENQQGLVLIKKKVTTHYIPPDMSAIKILFENYGQEISQSMDEIESMSDDELLKIKSELITELGEF